MLIRTRRFPIFSIVVLTLLSACGGSGGDGSGQVPDNDACELVGLPIQRALRVINGTPCGSLASSPIVRVITFKASTQQFSGCSGSMIAPDAVLTAAHCFLNSPSTVAVAIGPIDSVQSYQAVRWEPHPSFSQTNQGAFNDVAVVFLNTNLDLPVLPLLGSRSVESGEILAIYGYGESGSGETDFAELRSGEMEAADVTTNHILALYDGTGSNTCFGDSGGPIVADVGGGPAIAGITSTGALENCGPGDASLFVNIQSTSIADFVRSQVPNVTTR